MTPPPSAHPVYRPQPSQRPRAAAAPGGITCRCSQPLHSVARATQVAHARLASLCSPGAVIAASAFPSTTLQPRPNVSAGVLQQPPRRMLHSHAAAAEGHAAYTADLCCQRSQISGAANTRKLENNMHGTSKKTSRGCMHVNPSAGAGSTA